MHETQYYLTFILQVCHEQLLFYEDFACKKSATWYFCSMLPLLPEPKDHASLDGMTIAQLNAMIAFAKERSVSAAARYLGRDQSTVSRQLKNLEEGVSFKLARARGNESIPTNRCVELARRVERLLTEIKLFSAQHRENAVWVRLGGGALSLHSLVVPNLGIIRRIFEAGRATGDERPCRLSIANIRSHETVARLRSGQLDFGLARESEISTVKDLQSREVGRVGYCLVMSKALAREDGIESFDDAVRKRTPVVTLSGRGEFKRELYVRSKEAGQSLNLQDEMDFFADVVVAVRCNLVAGIVPETSLANEPDQHQFLRLPLPFFAERGEHPRYERSFHLAWNPAVLCNRDFPENCEKIMAECFIKSLARARAGS